MLVQLSLAVTQKVIFFHSPCLVSFWILCELYASFMCEMIWKYSPMLKYLLQTF